MQIERSLEGHLRDRRSLAHLRRFGHRHDARAVRSARCQVLHERVYVSFSQAISSVTRLTWWHSPSSQFRGGQGARHHLVDPRLDAHPPPTPLGAIAQGPVTHRHVSVIGGPMRRRDRATRRDRSSAHHAGHGQLHDVVTYRLLTQGMPKVSARRITTDFGIQIFRDCSRSQKALIVSLLQRILLSHSRVSDGDDDMATAYVARFTRRILGMVGQESRVASPRLPETTNGSGVQDSDFMAELVSSHRPLPGSRAHASAFN